LWRKEPHPGTLPSFSKTTENVRRLWYLSFSQGVTKNSYPLSCWVNNYRRFERSYFLHFQGKALQQERVNGQWLLCSNCVLHMAKAEHRQTDRHLI
jgi:hypothetical protein